MDKINDTGKVWLKGKVKPIFALRVGDTIIIPDMEQGDMVEIWLCSEGVGVDLNDSQKEVRIARWFPLSAEGDCPGTLFSGFDNTKHADILAVMPDNPAVLEKIFENQDYQEVSDLDRDSFWARAGLVK